MHKEWTTHRKLNQTCDGDGVTHLEIPVTVSGWILLVVAHKDQTLVYLSVIVAQDIHRILGVFALQRYAVQAASWPRRSRAVF